MEAFKLIVDVEKDKEKDLREYVEEKRRQGEEYLSTIFRPKNFINFMLTGDYVRFKRQGMPEETKEG